MRELAQHITDLVENSARAGAHRVSILVKADSLADILTLTVTDDGNGMAPEVAERSLDPFFTSRSSRRVGLGLPLLAAAADRCGGGVSVESVEGRGTTVVATFKLGHIDTPPLGDIKSTLICAIVGHPEIEFLYRHSADGRLFEMDGGAVKHELGDLSLSHPLVLRWLEDCLSSGLAAVRVAALEEDADA